MKRLLQEPLLHFVLLGISLFAVDAFLRDRTADASGGEIVVSKGRVESLSARFIKAWQRPPTVVELRGLIDDHVLEEALYREGVKLGVDRDDTIIRRRVRQKMEFVLEDVVELADPSDAELESWFVNHPELYAPHARWTFRQVCLTHDRRGEDLRTDAERLLEELRSAAGSSSAVDARDLGDTSLLDHAHTDSPDDAVAAVFGETFANRLTELPLEAWSGPIESPFGLHLVFVEARVEGPPPAFSDVREAVERDWRYSRRAEASKRYYADLVGQYSVTIDWPREVPGGEPSSSDDR